MTVDSGQYNTKEDGTNSTKAENTIVRTCTQNRQKKIEEAEKSGSG